VRANALENNVRFYRDGTQMFTVDDTTFSEAGKIALWTKADSVTLFDRIELTSAP
jgi:hypothetical protein